VLQEAQSLGFVGPGPVGGHIALARALADACPSPPRSALDLGSGGGIPGLVLALHWSQSAWVLLESQLRRTEFLQAAIRRLDIDGRVEVHRARAEEAGREPELRGTFDLVVARSFGVPAVTAECGAPFLALGGRLVVAEPPGAPERRWPAPPLADLGLAMEARAVGPPAWVALIQVRRCPDRFPRPTGVPAKRPLYRVDPADRNPATP